MNESVLTVPRPVRRRLRKVVQKPGDANYGRRAHAVLLLWESGGYVSGVAETLCAARSSVNRWRAVLKHLTALVEGSPQDYGTVRSRWSSELLAIELSRQLTIQVHATTVRRWLARLQYGWRRARPTLHIRDPRKTERMRAIDQALASSTQGTEVFYSDEVDIDLNPKIGAMWTHRGQQRTIPTPGQNQKRYLVGALHARTGKVLWSEGPSKNTDLFLALLEHLRARYRRARRIVLIVDNYRIHKSRLARAWLKHNPKFELLFQPTYPPGSTTSNDCGSNSTMSSPEITLTRR